MGSRGRSSLAGAGQRPHIENLSYRKSVPYARRTVARMLYQPPSDSEAQRDKNPVTEAPMGERRYRLAAGGVGAPHGAIPPLFSLEGRDLRWEEGWTLLSIRSKKFCQDSGYPPPVPWYTQLLVELQASVIAISLVTTPTRRSVLPTGTRRITESRCIIQQRRWSWERPLREAGCHRVSFGVHQRGR